MAITKIGTPELFDFSSLNTALQLPTGNTASRPSGPSTGEWRFNTDLKYVEYWDSTAWRQIDTESIPILPEFPAQNFNINTYFGTGAAQTIDAKFNEAANFNGTDSLITLDNSLDATLGVNNFSYSFWTKGPMTTTWKVWISLAKNAFVYIGYNEGGTGGLMVSNYSQYFKSNITISADTWTHIGFAKSSANGILLTKNGTSTTPYTDTSAAAKADLGTSGSNQSNVIGDYSGGGLPFEGFMDQVRFYNAALDSSDFNYIYTNETATTASQLNPSGFPSGCIAAYQLDGNATDVSGTYSGTVSNVSFTGLQFQPDFIWAKTITASGRGHRLFDSVRGINSGTSSYFEIATDSTADQDGISNTLTSINANGFSLGSNLYVNQNNETLVSWNWKAGGAPTATNIAGVGAVPTPDSVKINGSNATAALTGSIAASKISANTEAGFSIITYTGTGVAGTVDHLLGVAPDLVIIKLIDGNISTGSWIIGSSALTDWTKILKFSSSSGEETQPYFNDTAPTNTVFSVNNNNFVNRATCTYVAYCFANLDGYQKIGTYLGNGLATGDPVTTGFEPAFLLYVARSSGSGSWGMVDNKRNTTNPREATLQPGSDTAQFNFGDFDFSSTGFQPADNNSDTNGAGTTYLYYAISS